MLQYLGLEMPMLLLALSAIFTFGAVIISLKLFKNKLPVDGGRDFAFNGKLSKGKHKIFIFPPGFFRLKFDIFPVRRRDFRFAHRRRCGQN